jgi:hypothetical protein
MLTFLDPDLALSAGVATSQWPQLTLADRVPTRELPDFGDLMRRALRVKTLPFDRAKGDAQSG